MTREEARKWLPIITAFSEGKAIQYIGNDLKWHDYNQADICFEGDIKTVKVARVKPETKYRPFIDIEECWEEMRRHQPFGWVKNRNEKSYQMITTIVEADFPVIIHPQMEIAFNAMLAEYTFADGTPFGILKDYF